MDNPLNNSLTLWFTGLSGAGKSTLAYALKNRLNNLGYRCSVLDGDEIRKGLSSDLSFSPEDRTENIRRAAEVARLMNNAGLIVLAAFISPYRKDREMAQTIIGKNHFMEIYLNADINTCERRDPKGLYRNARIGKISSFTGITAPYEVPQAPALEINTATNSIEHCIDALMIFLASTVFRVTPKEFAKPQLERQP